MSSAPLICVIDDDQSVCESVDGLLSSAGFDVETFTSAADFLEWSESNRADCLVVDFAMPGVNGLELWRALLARGADVPCIFATALSREDLTEELIASGAFTVFQKPLDAGLFLDAVRRATARD
jgi:FixJ family two-component response regulator